MKSGMAAIKTAYAAQGIQVVWPYRQNGVRVKQVIPAGYTDQQAHDVKMKLSDDYERVRQDAGAGQGGNIYQFDDAGRPRGDMIMDQEP